MTTATMAAGDVATQAARRHTFAVISHPDAGKSTLTEALALHARVISTAGAVHGKSGRRGVVSDWMDIERTRGISITSAALQFEYGDVVLNLLDTPGHADFSEDTYRVLSAVDGAVMLPRRRGGPGAADAEAVRRVPLSRHPGDHVHQQVGPPGQALFTDRWRLESVHRSHPDITLAPLVADH